MILALDTTTEQILVGYLVDDIAYTDAVTSSQASPHSKNLIPALSQLRDQHGLGDEKIDGIVCCVGPGGFTNLRIGIATAEGLSVDRKPTWGFTGFDLYYEALQLGKSSPQVAIALEGQRGDLFVQYFSDNVTAGAPVKMPLIEFINAKPVTHPWWAPRDVQLKIGSLPGLVDLEIDTSTKLKALISIAQKLTKTAPTPLIPFYLRETDAEVLKKK